MQFSGTVQGEAANKYQDFRYRKAIETKIDIWNIDPERIDPANEYPRYVNPPSLERLKTVDLADYEVKVESLQDDGTREVQVWMMPNKYTPAVQPRVVYSVAVAGTSIDIEQFVDYTLERVFRV